MPLFSILIPVYNREKLIAETIDSVLNQSLKDFEIIVIDDGSTDNSVGILKSYGEKIVLLQQNNNGPEVARNFAADKAKGDYFVFLDSDDVFFPWTLETYKKLIEKYNQPSIVIGKLTPFRNDKPPEYSEKDKLPIQVVVYDDYLKKDRTHWSSCSLIVVKKKTFFDAGGLRNSSPKTFHIDDHNFFLRSCIYGPTILVEHPDTLLYRLHETNAINNFRLIVNGVKALINSERLGEYPGGSKRKLERMAAIGGPVYGWTLTMLHNKQYLLAADLFFSGLPMLIAKLYRKLILQAQGFKQGVNVE